MRPAHRWVLPATLCTTSEAQHMLERPTGLIWAVFRPCCDGQIETIRNGKGWAHRLCYQVSTETGRAVLRLVRVLHRRRQRTYQAPEAFTGVRNTLGFLAQHEACEQNDHCSSSVVWKKRGEIKALVTFRKT